MAAKAAGQFNEVSSTYFYVKIKNISIQLQTLTFITFDKKKKKIIKVKALVGNFDQCASRLTVIWYVAKLYPPLNLFMKNKTFL